MVNQLIATTTVRPNLPIFGQLRQWRLFEIAEEEERDPPALFVRAIDWFPADFSQALPYVNTATRSTVDTLIPSFGQGTVTGWDFQREMLAFFIEDTLLDATQIRFDGAGPNHVLMAFQLKARKGLDERDADIELNLALGITRSQFTYAGTRTTRVLEGEAHEGTFHVFFSAYPVQALLDARLNTLFGGSARISSASLCLPSPGGALPAEPAPAAGTVSGRLILQIFELSQTCLLYTSPSPRDS